MLRSGPQRSYNGGPQITSNLIRNPHPAVPNSHFAIIKVLLVSTKIRIPAANALFPFFSFAGQAFSFYDLLSHFISSGAVSFIHLILSMGSGKVKGEAAKRNPFQTSIDPGDSHDAG